MNLIEYGEKFFDELEISTYRKREISVDASLNQVSMSASLNRVITVIRGVKDGRMGIYIVDSEDEEKIKRGIEMAARNARSNERDDKWVSFPSPGNYGRKWDKEFEPEEPDFYVSLMNEAIGDIRKRDERAMVAGGSAGAVWSGNSVMNSHGVDVEQEFGAHFFYIYAMGRTSSGVTPGILDYDVEMTRHPDRDAVVDSILNKLSKAYTKVPAEGNEGNVLVEPLAMGMLLYYTLIPAINGERKVKGTSPLVGKVGEKILSEKITIVDDPWHPMSINPIVADDEGVPTRRKSVFENGIFKGFLWNSYWGNVEGVGSTGNGVRSLSTGGVGISPNNIVLEKGSKALEDILSEMRDGYYISGFQGAHSSNPDTGDFSVVANPAFRVKDGEIVGSTVFMMSGNVYSLLNSVGEVSSQERRIMMMGNGILPYIEFENVKIAPVGK